LLDKLDLLSKYKTIGEVVKKEWKGISHNPLKLCEKYKIELKNNEIILNKYMTKIQTSDYQQNNRSFICIKH
jgi:hypothetical protein